MNPTRIVIVNGSPKGDYSLTLQHARYLVSREPGIAPTILNAGEALSEMAYDQAWLDGAIAAIESCDAVIWATPVYTMLVPWQLIRFFDLIQKAGKSPIFTGKYATCVMSCFHYYDHLAEEWLRGTCEDLGMPFIEGLSVDNEDMLKPEIRASMRFFMAEFHRACTSRAPVARKTAPITDPRPPRFSPAGMASTPSTPNTGVAQKNPDLRTVLLTDERGKDGNLSRMIDAFLAAYPNRVEVVDINDFPYEGACQGCLRCELVGDCDRKDGFQQFYQDLVNSCDVLVQAMNIEGRYLAPVWKLFLDRTFSNGHRTSMMGKHTCYLVAGPLRQLPNVRQFLEGKDRVGRENSMGIISDEEPDSARLQALVADLAARTDRAARAKYQKGVNFLGVGGIKIFRDLIYGMRGVVRDDHRFYRERGLYDFPQRNLPKQAFNLVMGAAFTLKPVREQAFRNMKPLYIAQHKMLVESGKP